MEAPQASGWGTYMEGLTPLAFTNCWMMHGSGGALILSDKSLHASTVHVQVRGSEKLGVCVVVRYGSGQWRGETGVNTATVAAPLCARCQRCGP